MDKPIASFIFVEGSMAKINTCRYLVPGFYWRIYGEKFRLKIRDSGMPTYTLLCILFGEVCKGMWSVDC